MSDEQVQQRIWETRCPELLVECERLRALLAEAVRWLDGDFDPTMTEHYEFVGRARVALGEADDE